MKIENLEDLVFGLDEEQLEELKRKVDELEDFIKNVSKRN